MQSVSPTSNAPNANVVTGPTVVERRAPQSIEERLVQNRLGIYSALFMALRAKHPPTAAHSLRVALGCSKWAAVRRMSEPERELLEIAGLLHDLGKIGVPDRVLQKTEGLIGSENSLMQLHVELAMELMAGAGASPDLLDIIRLSHNRVNEETNHFIPASQSSSVTIPIAARMLAIADAFDSMTSEQPFRRAISREVAISELTKNGGSQFDLALVQEFSYLVAQPPGELEKLIGNRWLNELTPHQMPGFSGNNLSASSGAMQTLIDTLYHRQLLESMSDAAIYVDYDGRILSWNRAAEELSGRSAASMLHQTLNSTVIGLKTIGGGQLVEERCPIRQALNRKPTANQKFSLKKVDGRELPVNLDALIVQSAKSEFCGVIFMIRDASQQADLEEQVQNLHEIATTDNLTNVSNRGELSRYLPQFVSQHVTAAMPGSLIICDIDHFKRINDTYGHPAGDEALVVFAQVLKQLARAGDMVARFGGEEFVLLCANCDIAAAASRAEDIRRAVEGTPVSALRNQCLTASFGVTAIQPGDDQDTLLARADRALLVAKDSGRNRVVQLGDSAETEEDTSKRTGWFNWFAASQAKTALLEKDFLTAVPQDIAVERLSGFINDHNAEIVKVDGHRVAIRINSRESAASRRQNDRPIELLMEVLLEQVDVRPQSVRGSIQRQTKMHVTFSTVKPRDRRYVNVLEQATQLIINFRSYLVAQEMTEEMQSLIIQPR